MRAHLTDATVRSLKPTEKQEKVWDTKTPGFGVRINGRTKTWIVMYGPKRTLKTLGRYPAVSLADARKEALVYLGTTPVPTTAPKFGPALETFLAEHYEGKRGRTKHEAKRLLERHFIPSFEKRPLDTISDQDVKARLDPLGNTPSERLHAFRAIRTFFNWSTRPPRRYIKQSPLQGYEPPGQDAKGTRKLSDAELKAVWLACDKQPHFFGKMVKLLILWGTRNGETGRLQRKWIEDGVLTIPGTHTKNKRPHAIPLLPMAKELLDSLPMAGVYFFPGKKPGTHFNDGSWGKFKQELDEHTGINEPWQLRDLRRTFRTNMSRLKVPRSLCEQMLNHVTGAGKNDLDEIYDRYEYLDEKREALLKHEQFLTKLLAA
jgi:integrase